MLVQETLSSESWPFSPFLKSDVIFVPLGKYGQIGKEISSGSRQKCLFLTHSTFRFLEEWLAVSEHLEPVDAVDRGGPFNPLEFHYCVQLVVVGQRVKNWITVRIKCQIYIQSESRYSYRLFILRMFLNTGTLWLRTLWSRNRTLVFYWMNKNWRRDCLRAVVVLNKTAYVYSLPNANVTIRWHKT